MILGPLVRAFGSILYVLIQLVAFLLMLVGFVVVFILAVSHDYASRPSPYYPRTVLTWRGGWLTFLWGNAEDGVDGLRGGDPAQFWWRDRTAGWSTWRRIWVWSAWRNSVNNLRFLVKWVGGPLWEPTFRGSQYRFGWNSNGFPVFERL